MFAAVSAFAAQITGTVTNGTTNKPSSGDEVVLTQADGISEVARTKTDSQGHYTLSIPDQAEEHMIRVARQSVHYFAPVPPGSTTVDITVYDAATQLESIVANARVFRLQTSAGSLDVSDEYILNNQSQPPRSRIGNQTFAVTLPEGAEMDRASITGPSGMRLPVTPVPSGVKDRYAFDFPIRPGEMRFEVIYRLPYSGSYEFSIAPETGLSELGVLLPKSMKFTGVSSGFAQDSDEAGLAVFFAKNVAANQQVKFSVSGMGLIAQNASGVGDGQPAGAAATPSSGGASVTNLQISGAVMFVILVGAFVLWRKAAAGKSAGKSTGNRPVPQAAKTRAQAQAQSAKAAPADMLDVLKDELFQLETDRVNGKVSQEEYEKTKAGLDTLFRRQMKKK